ncbi:alcohol dehydrogenase [Agrobacterium vitis]|uniref:alcohol dehydrogenase catalytic domain-containing protein n=1 Tax=Agrobacterium vitis TaxID=373 RepID=UPI001F20502D|nr:medium chain dehydrogenase/reductase family protein [Agrobacterium vitis]MCF1469216.1 alcohol dehydrogenase [Agrobacterium vitis]
MTASHRAVVRANGTTSVLDRQTSTPSDHELLVAPLHVGLCGTDIQMLRGLRSDPTPVIGHEGVCRVVAVGNDAPEWITPGTLVCINPTHRDDPSFLLGHNVEGLLQERVLIPSTAVLDGLVLPLSEAMNAEIATLIEPLAVVHYALHLLAEHKPDTIVIFGDGVIGQIAARAATDILGADARIVHVHHTARGIEWSANHAVSTVHRILHDKAGAQYLANLPSNARVAVLLATPRDATLLCLDTALQNIRGELAINLLGGLPPNAASPLLPEVDLNVIRAANCAGAPNPPLRFSLSTITGKTVSLMGHRGVANRHLKGAVAELAEFPSRYQELITHVATLDEAATIMQQLATSRDRIVNGRRLIKLAVQIEPKQCRLRGDL